MSDKFTNFVAALEEICIAHKVMICSSMYDNLQVWNSNNDAWCDCLIEDMTDYDGSCDE